MDRLAPQKNNKGTGLAYASFCLAERYAIKMAILNGGTPSDYFALDHNTPLDKIGWLK